MRCVNVTKYPEGWKGEEGVVTRANGAKVWVQRSDGKIRDFSHPVVVKLTKAAGSSASSSSMSSVAAMLMQPATGDDTATKEVKAAAGRQQARNIFDMEPEDLDLFGEGGGAQEEKPNVA